MHQYSHLSVVYFLAFKPLNTPQLVRQQTLCISPDEYDIRIWIYQLYGINEAPQPTSSVSYNAELVKPISPEMQKKLWENLNK